MEKDGAWFLFPSVRFCCGSDSGHGIDERRGISGVIFQSSFFPKGLFLSRFGTYVSALKWLAPLGPRLKTGKRGFRSQSVLSQQIPIFPVVPCMETRDAFETFSAFRAWRARENPVRGGLVPKYRPELSERFGSHWSM